AARARRARRVRWSRRTGRSRREWRPWRARPTLLDVPERAQQPVGLLDVDLHLSEQLEDLLAFFAGHLQIPSRLVELRRILILAHLALCEALEEIADLRHLRRRPRRG